MHETLAIAPPPPPPFLSENYFFVATIYSGKLLVPVFFIIILFIFYYFFLKEMFVFHGTKFFSGKIMALICIINYFPRKISYTVASNVWEIYGSNLFETLIFLSAWP